MATGSEGDEGGGNRRRAGMPERKPRRVAGRMFTGADGTSLLTLRSLCRNARGRRPRAFSLPIWHLAGRRCMSAIDASRCRVRRLAATAHSGSSRSCPRMSLPC